MNLVLASQGGRSARDIYLGRGRHIIMQPLDSLPDAHAPEIKQADQNKLALRLIRDKSWLDRKSLSWPPGEESAY